MPFNGMAQVEGGVQFITIATPFSLAFQILSIFQFGDDSLHGALRNADMSGHIAQPLLRLRGQAEQNMSVVSEEGPSRDSRRRVLSLLCITGSIAVEVCPWSTQEHLGALAIVAAVRG